MDKPPESTHLPFPANMTLVPENRHHEELTAMTTRTAYITLPHLRLGSPVRILPRPAGVFTPASVRLPSIFTTGRELAYVTEVSPLGYTVTPGPGECHFAEGVGGHELEAVTVEGADAKGLCEARWSPDCMNGGVHAHHKRRRSQGGQDTAGNLLWVCTPCHLLIHDEIAEAVERGFLTHTEAP